MAIISENERGAILWRGIGLRWQMEVSGNKKTENQSIIMERCDTELQKKEEKQRKCAMGAGGGEEK